MDFDFLGLEMQQSNHQIPVEFTVKPSGDISFKGDANVDLIQQLMDNSDYKSSVESKNKHLIADKKLNLRYQIDLENARANNLLNLMTIGFLGIGFSVVVVCTFISFNQGNHEYREPVRGYCR